MASENSQVSGTYTYYWDELTMGRWYESSCYVCGVEYSFKFDYPIGNVKLMLIDAKPHAESKGHICAPVCSEECHLNYKALLVMAK